MLLRSLTGSSVVLCSLLLASAARAQCGKDTDCKGDRLCENGVCVAPSAPAPAPAASAPAPSAAVVPAPDAVGVASPPAAPTVALPASVAPPAPAPPQPEPPTKFRSPVMVVGGALMLMFAPMAAFMALTGTIHQGDCYENRLADCSDYDLAIYGGLIGVAVLVGGGGTLVAIGAKKVPATAAAVRLSPWATPRALGLGLRLDL